MINGIGQVAVAAAGVPTEIAEASRSESKGATRSFGSELADAVQNVERSIGESRAVTQGLIRGESIDIHQVAMRAQEAQLSFEMFLQVRNKLIQGYQEIMRMQV